MREVTGQAYKINYDEVAVTFVDYMGNNRTILCKIDERLPELPLMPGTSPVVSL